MAASIPSMLEASLFHIAFATLLAHELDAVHKQEWKLLFVLRTMSNETARQAFVLLHVPLLATIFFLLGHPSDRVRLWTMVSLSVFIVAHAGLHWRLESRPEYAFTTTHSRILIYGPAVFALAHLGIVWTTR
jgi:hypothetical protein